MREKSWRHKGIRWDKKDEEYTHETWCVNCKFRFSVYIKKGVSIKTVMDDIDCPKCGVKQTSMKWE